MTKKLEFELVKPWNGQKAKVGIESYVDCHLHGEELQNWAFARLLELLSVKMMSKEEIIYVVTGEREEE